MTTKEKLLAAQLLKEAAGHYGDHSCNDFTFPTDWTPEEVDQFSAEYHSWNGMPTDHNPNFPLLPDFAVMAFLASKLACEVEAFTATQMNPSDTPRVDAECAEGDIMENWVSADFARQLERELNAQIESWKQGMTDAAKSVRNNPKYAGEHWLPEGIESLLDQAASVSLEIQPQAGALPPVPGMAMSDKCQFCGEFYDKAKPFICPQCWENVKSVVAQYREELLRTHFNLV